MKELILLYGLEILLLLLSFVLGGALIYLIMRPLVLWYFKIYAIISELQENNALLRGIQEELMKKNMHSPSSLQKQEDNSKYMPR